MDNQLTKSLAIDLAKGKDQSVQVTYLVKDGEAKIINTKKL